MADLLMKVKSSDKIYLVVPPSVFSGSKIDFNNLKLVTIEAPDFEKAFEGVWMNRSSFIGKANHGVAFLLCSIVMTKGPEFIKK